MKRTWCLLLALLVICPAAVLAGTTQCAKYHVRLEGTSVPVVGYTYTEIVEMHKVGQASGYDGKWQIDNLTQINTYPIPISPPIATFERVDFGDGQWMDCAASSQGSVLTSICSGGQLFLDVRNNRVGSLKYGNWSGTITGKQVQFQFDPTNPAEPVITGYIRQPEKKKLTLNIVSPSDVKQVFSSDNPGELTMDLVADVTPTQYEQEIEWILPNIEGSTRTVEPASGRGRHVTVTYKGLPESNDQFGPKTIVAMVNVGGCATLDTRQVKVFYLRDAANNPGGQQPNWFYYWKQTPAGKPRGQLVNLEYGGLTVGHCTDPRVPAQYTPGLGHATIHVCDLNKLGSEFQNRFPKVSINPPYFEGWGESKYIDTFATLVIHEFVHWQAYHTWREGKTLQQMNAEDTDQDGVPNTAEADFHFDPAKFQTHFPNHPELKNIGGDEEWLAYSSMVEIKFGTLDKYDWARPGKQWP